MMKPAGSMIRQVSPKQAHIRRMVAALGAMSGWYRANSIMIPAS
jgi:hypothetical protein